VARRWPHSAFWLRLADRLGVAVGYAVALGAGTALLHSRPRAERDAWLDWASTNLANAPHHPIGALVVSALFTDGDVRGWLVLSLVGLGAVGWRFGAWRTATLVAAAHVIGTVVSEGILGIRIATGAVPRTELHIRDIGPSYVVVAALVAGLVYGPWPAKLPCALGFASVAPSLFGGLLQFVVPSVGHVCAITVALAMGGLFVWRRRRRTAGAAVGPPVDV
jgi:MYXO-CTERM domain-containing protein